MLNNRPTPVLVLIEEVVDGRSSPVHILIGTASPDSDTTLPIPNGLIREGGEQRFVLHPVGGSDLPTQVIRLGDEARIEIMVPAVSAAPDRSDRPRSAPDPADDPPM